MRLADIAVARQPYLAAGERAHRLLLLLGILLAVSSAPAWGSDSLLVHATFDGAGNGASALAVTGGGVAKVRTSGAIKFVSGRSGRALQFSGKERLHVTLKRPFPCEAGTVALWMRPDFGAEEKKGHVFFTAPTQDGSGNDNYQVQWVSAGRLLVRAGKMSGSELYMPDLQFSRGDWVHMVMAWDARSLELYVDGKRAAADVTVDLSLTPGKVIHIGGWPDGSRTAKAALDDFRVYDRKLTATEVAQLAGGASGRALGPSPPQGRRVTRPAPVVRPPTDQPDVLLHMSFDEWPVRWARPLRMKKGKPGLRVVPGKFGQALEIARGGVQINVGDLWPIDRGTVACWVKPNWDGNHKESRVFFHVGTSSRQVMDNYHIQTYGGSLSARAGCMSTKEAVGSSVGSAIQRNWKVGEWHFVVLTWGPRAVRMFVDGKVAAAKDKVSYPFKPRDQLIIGCWSGGSRSADAALDEFWVFTRDLSDGEIRALWKQNTLSHPKKQ